MIIRRIMENQSITQKSLNHLANQASPYLFQHADNPVDWYPWSQEAFARARREDKPIFLSIGYSTCHWCHVMAHESFEDDEVARLLNEVFVCIKLDREERPDIDGVYMDVCQMLTGSGGWPLTIMMTPDKKPFFAATYIPKNNRFGRMGLLELIPRVKQLWSHEREQLNHTAAEITTALQKNAQITSGGEKLEISVLDQAYQELSRRFDRDYGGFAPAPKFPTPHNLTFLLRYWHRTGEPQALEMVEKTLQAMRRGGIYDHIGFGFHRYSTDHKWLVPHFEKMLYDQALISLAYVQTYQATGKAEYAQTVREIFKYVLRDMTDSEGGFYSAEDADSEGVEGKFYLWTEDEIKKALPVHEADLVIKLFDISDEGNFTDEASGDKTGSNIMHLSEPIEQVAAELKISESKLLTRWQKARQKLFSVRENRIRPYKDDKILTDWNGLIIAALAQAGRILPEPVYAQAAQKAADFILDTLIDSQGHLLHRYRQGRTSIRAHLNDYAFFIWGLLELYETTFEVRFLEKALNFSKDMCDLFGDEKTGGFFFTAGDSEELLVRRKEIYDGAVPSGNSIALLNLFRIGRITGNDNWQSKAESLAQHFAPRVRKTPSAYTQLLQSIDFNLGPAYEVVIAGNLRTDETKTMLEALWSKFLPGKIVLHRPDVSSQPDITKIAPYTKNQPPHPNQTTAYICRNYSCLQPTTDPHVMLGLLCRKNKF